MHQRNETTCLTLVRPVLKYAAVIWDPHQQYLIDNINEEQLNGLWEIII